MLRLLKWHGEMNHLLTQAAETEFYIIFLTQQLENV
jgi:hypothetical protein